MVGHVVQDLVSERGEWRLGGAVSYASLLARNLGLRTAVLTSCAKDVPLSDLLPGVEVCIVPSESTTQFRNVYRDDGVREQWVPSRARVLTVDDLPEAWREARVVLLGPVAGEIDESLATAFGRDSIIGIGAQGWLREIGPDSRVRPVSPSEWRAGPRERATALFLSDEDLPLEDAPSALGEWSAQVDVLAFTRGYDGADVCYRGEWRHFNAYPATPVDLTGAGDVFAAGFLARFAETRDPWEATRLASAAASLVIEGMGVEGVPTREMVEGRMGGL